MHLPVFRAITHSSYHRAVATSLGYFEPLNSQSQLIAKCAGSGGCIASHQDGCISFTDPPSAMTFWYALEDATLENGCLEVAAGSRLTEPLRQRYVKAGGVLEGRITKLEEPLWLHGKEGLRKDESGEEGLEYTPLEVEKGTLILFNGNLMHRSGANQSAKDRAAYSFSIIEGGMEVPLDSLISKGAVETL